MVAPPAPIPIGTVMGSRQTERLAAQEYQLVLLNTEGAGQRWSLSQGPLKVGKSGENDVVIDHPTVSRNHLTVERQGDRFLIQDLGSTNGTFLDGAQVREAFLRPGAVLEVGDVQLRLQSTVSPVRIDPTTEARLGELVGTSVAMRQIFALLDRIAPRDRW